MAATRILPTIAVLAALGFAALPSTTLAGPDAVRLHIQGHMGAGGSGVDIDVPWSAARGDSPFNFTGDACDHVSVERLRTAWNALQHVPEGEEVTIRTRSESILASRQSGYLVLVPQPNRGDDHHARIKIPDYIVRAFLDNDGRLADHDVERLLRERGKVTLVKVNSDVGGVTVWMERAD